MPARSLPGHARSASGERIRFDYTDLVVLHPVLHGGRLPKGKGGPPARGRRRVKIFFMLLELSLPGTSTRIKLKTACRSCPERCDWHEVSAFCLLLSGLVRCGRWAGWIVSSPPHIHSKPVPLYFPLSGGLSACARRWAQFRVGLVAWGMESRK